jgi:hypothetical protein
MPAAFFRNNIPVNSELTIRISSDDDDMANVPVTADALVTKPDRSTQAWTDADLRNPATPPLLLDQTGIYTGRMDLRFAAATTVRVRIDIRKPDGTGHVFNELFTQTAPGLDFVHILLRVV